MWPWVVPLVPLFTPARRGGGSPVVATPETHLTHDNEERSMSQAASSVTTQSSDTPSPDEVLRRLAKLHRDLPPTAIYAEAERMILAGTAAIADSATWALESVLANNLAAIRSWRR